MDRHGLVSSRGEGAIALLGRFRPYGGGAANCRSPSPSRRCEGRHQRRNHKSAFPSGLHRSRRESSHKATDGSILISGAICGRRSVRDVHRDGNDFEVRPPPASKASARSPSRAGITITITTTATAVPTGRARARAEDFARLHLCFSTVSLPSFFIPSRSS